jgi:hypothetical protein
MKYLVNSILLAALIFHSIEVLCQGQKIKPIDLNLVPGFGTSGLDYDLG